jgi:ABC-type multidrug transport system permease subunit
LFLQVPYLVVSSLIFIIPFFYIVGFDVGDAAGKFFWYWLFQHLYVTIMVYFGQFLGMAMPNAQAAAGLYSSVSVFCS